MLFRVSVITLAAMLAFTTACTNKKVSNPLAKVDSKQPDKVLFDRGMDAMKHNHFDVARLAMETLINTYPDSEFIARAKLALADSWYAEGGSAGMAQAEQQYRDFITFFPNMPEAAEAQVKIANIHFQQMEKPDRDYTHAERAEEEYRQVILQYPDNPKMVAEARTRLLQVQEVLAEREYRVGRFYYMRESYPAAIARLETLVDRYPLYSKADEALYLLGQSYEGEIAAIRHMGDVERAQMEKLHRVNEAQLKNDKLARERMIDDFTAKATAAYSKILTRYPVMNRADDAKARLLALHQPVPRPTVAMLKQNKAEEDSRREESIMDSMLGMLSKHPDVSAAARVGNPSLQTQEPVSPTTIVQEASAAASGTKTGDNTVSGVVEGTGNLENQPAPRSDDSAQPASAAATTTPTAQSDPNELTPNTGNAAAGTTAQTSDPNELRPNVSSDPPATAPPQVNEIPSGGGSGTAQTSADGKSPANDSQLASDQMIASSKHKKKKGLEKIIPIK